MQSIITCIQLVQEWGSTEVSRYVSELVWEWASKSAKSVTRSWFQSAAKIQLCRCKVYKYKRYKICGCKINDLMRKKETGFLSSFDLPWSQPSRFSPWSPFSPDPLSSFVSARSFLFSLSARVMPSKDCRLSRMFFYFQNYVKYVSVVELQSYHWTLALGLIERASYLKAQCELSCLLQQRFRSL